MTGSLEPSSNQMANFLPPLIRLIVELSTWLWLLIIGLRQFQVNLIGIDVDLRIIVDPWIYLVLFVLSLAALSQLNFPGDKKDHGILVPGWIRIFVEVSSGFLGIFAAWILFDILGAGFQLILVGFSFFLDRDRWKWFLGLREHPPRYVLVLDQYRK